MAAHAGCLHNALPLVVLEKLRESGPCHGEVDLWLVSSDAGIQRGPGRKDTYWVHMAHSRAESWPAAFTFLWIFLSACSLHLRNPWGTEHSLFLPVGWGGRCHELNQASSFSLTFRHWHPSPHSLADKVFKEAMLLKWGCGDSPQSMTVVLIRRGDQDTDTQGPLCEHSGRGWASLSQGKKPPN